MPKGQRKNSKKKGVVRRKSRTQKNKKLTMKGGSDNDSTTWTATDKGGGNTWEVLSGTKIEEIYKLDNKRLHILKEAEKTTINELFDPTETDTNAKRANLNAIEQDDKWSGKITGYSEVVATTVKNDEVKKLQSVTLTFTKEAGVPNQPFETGDFTFVLLDVNK